MTVLITLTTAGLDAGPFDLYSNIDGYVTAFATNITKQALLDGYTSSVVPDSTTTVRVKSTGTCTNYINIPISGITTTTTSSSSTTTTTTTTATEINLDFSFETSGGSTRSATLYVNNVEVFSTSIDDGIFYPVAVGDQIRARITQTGCETPAGFANVYCTGIIGEDDCNSSGAILNTSTYTVTGSEGPILTLFCTARCDDQCV